MVGLDDGYPITANGSSVDRPSSKQSSCDHKCTVITLSIAIPLLSLLLLGLLAFGLFQRRKAKRESKAKEAETELAMRKLRPESETSSIISDGFGDFRPVTVLENGVEVEQWKLQRPGRSWRPGAMGSKTVGWWRGM